MTPHRVPDWTRVYAVGDIHGRADLLARLHRLILEDDATAGSAARRVLVYLGDYIDRGPDSFEVLDRLLDEPLDGFETIHLKGNHEDFLLHFLDDLGRGEIWLLNGGDATLRSYGIDVPDPLFGLLPDPSELEFLRRRLAAAMPDRHLDFLRGLRLSHVERDYLFVHAGLRPGVALEAQTEEDMLWIREAFLHSPASFEKMIVHGHTVTPAPAVRANRIGVDTGAYRSGRLSCLVLEGTDRRFLHT